MRLAGLRFLPILVVLSILVVLGCGQDGDLPACREGMALVDVTVIDGLGNPPSPGQTVLVCDGVIADVAPTETIRLPRGVQEVALVDRYVLPGMVDTGVSVTAMSAEGESGDRASMESADVEQVLRTLLAFGITTIRDPSERAGDVGGLRDAVSSGEMLGPRIETEGALFDLDEIDLEALEEIEASDDPAPRGTAVVPTLIAHRARLRADEPRHREHPELNLAPRSVREAWSRVATKDERGPEEYDRGREAWPRVLELIGKLYEEGGLLTAGSGFPDPWVIPGVGFHEELALLAEAGIPTLEVLRMATHNGAVALGLEEEIGSIEVGKRADLVILTADPVTYLRNTRAIDLVLLAGRPLKPSALLSQASDSN